MSGNHNFGKFSFPISIKKDGLKTNRQTKRKECKKEKNIKRQSLADHGFVESSVGAGVNMSYDVFIQSV